LLPTGGMLCLLTPTMQNRRITDAAFRRAGVSARVQSETDSILTFYTYVRYAGLFSVISHSRCRRNMPFILPVHSQRWYDGW